MILLSVQLKLFSRNCFRTARGTTKIPTAKYSPCSSTAHPPQKSPLLLFLRCFQLIAQCLRTKRFGFGLNFWAIYTEDQTWLDSWFRCIFLVFMAMKLKPTKSYSEPTKGEKTTKLKRNANKLNIFVMQTKKKTADLLYFLSSGIRLKKKQRSLQHTEKS